MWSGSQWRRPSCFHSGSWSRGAACKPKRTVKAEELFQECVGPSGRRASSFVETSDEVTPSVSEVLTSWFFHSLSRLFEDLKKKRSSRTIDAPLTKFGTWCSSRRLQHQFLLMKQSTITVSLNNSGGCKQKHSIIMYLLLLLFSRRHVWNSSNQNNWN